MIDNNLKKYLYKKYVPKTKKKEYYRYNRIEEIKKILNKLSNDKIKAKKQINAYILNITKKHNQEGNLLNKRELTKIRKTLNELK